MGRSLAGRRNAVVLHQRELETTLLKRYTARKQVTPLLRARKVYE